MTLGGQLWLDSDSDERVLVSLRRALTDLREALGTEAWRLESVTKFALRLNLDGGATCDVHEFDRALASVAPDGLDRAIDLYHGPLMPDLDAVYDPDGTLRNERERRHHVFLDAIERRAQRRRANHEAKGTEGRDGAISDLRRLLTADPTRESASRDLMGLLSADAASRPGAILEYLRLRRELAQQLGTKPTRATRTLYERIQIECQPKLGRPPTAPKSLTDSDSTLPTTSSKSLVTLLFAQIAPAHRTDDWETRIRQVLETNEGTLYAVEGDTYRAAFAFPMDAVAAIAEYGLLHSDSDLPVSGMRFAVHTGIPNYAAGSYTGAVTEATTALLAAGHPGQTLLTSVTAEVLRDLLPEGSSLRELGRHRFRSGDRTSLVYQWTQAGRPENFPPIRSLDPVPHNLPTRLTRFIGREKAIEEVRELLDRNRLVTLTGTGGAGKTRLSQQVAGDALDDFPDGVWLTELAALTDNLPIAAAVAAILGVKEQPKQDILETVIGYLKEKRLLIVLDNCEHLLSTCARFAADVLQACPNVKILATSRESIGIFGEQTYRVPSLTVPEPGKANADPTADHLAGYEAVQLFVDRARLAKSDFAFTNGNAAPVARLCRSLDGIPLALELAAARTRSLSLEQIDANLDDRFRLLTVGDRAALPRQQTLRALVDWSYDLLSDDEKALFVRLSVFVGGWTLDAAETVCDAAPLARQDVPKLLESLVDKSLVQAHEQIDGSRRYQMLETLRQYGAEKRTARADDTDLRCRHGRWCLALGQEAEPHLQGPQQTEWLQRLESERDNLRLALREWSNVIAANASSVASADAATVDATAGEAAMSGLQLSTVLSRFWLTRNYGKEGREQIARVLMPRAKELALHYAGELSAKKAIAGAIRAEGVLAWSLGDFSSAQSLYEESLALCREIADETGIATSLNYLGNVAVSRGELSDAQTLLMESLAIHRKMGNPRGIAMTRASLGLVAMDLGECTMARAHFEESLRLLRDSGDQVAAARMLFNLGMVAEDEGDFTSARSMYEESLQIKRELGDTDGIANNLNSLGNITDEQGDSATARGYFLESLALSRQANNNNGSANTLINLGGLSHVEGDYGAAHSYLSEGLTLFRDAGNKRGGTYGLFAMSALFASKGDPTNAIILYGAADALRDAIGFHFSPTEQSRIDAEIAQIREKMHDKTQFTTAWAKGLEMSWEQAVAFALGEDMP